MQSPVTHANLDVSVSLGNLHERSINKKQPRRRRNRITNLSSFQSSKKRILEVNEVVKCLQIVYPDWLELCARKLLKCRTFTKRKPQLLAIRSTRLSSLKPLTRKTNWPSSAPNSFSPKPLNRRVARKLFTCAVWESEGVANCYRSH